MLTNQTSFTYLIIFDWLIKMAKYANYETMMSFTYCSLKDAVAKKACLIVRCKIAEKLCNEV